ncbi:MAG: hypothetical protein CR994_07055 [Maribacter sp.]|nr:MAG: hypothetical protein CR994_07055 [Maribacter sp.]
MPLRRLAISLLLLTTITGYSQVPELSPLSKISVLTCGPGGQLYSTFGHSAFRIKDPAIGMDVVYNYGVFNFYSDNFYVKFAKGKLDYMLARQQYANFIREYKYDKRWVKEQTLRLSQTERNRLFQFLEHNYLPKNRGYPYDFFYNNCATKIWDVLDSVYGDNLVFNKNYLGKQYTHRELIHQNIPVNSWSCLGIDLALGSVIDDLASPKEHMFLPQYNMRQLNYARLRGRPLVSNEVSVYQPKTTGHKNNFLLTPLFWSLLSMIVIFILTYRDNKDNRRAKGLDLAIFLVTGLVGTLIFFLWFLTEHTATANNLNILWAFPFNLVLAFLVGRKKALPAWTTIYILFLILMLFLLILLWAMKVQLFSPVLIPILLALGIRYSFLYSLDRRQKKTIPEHEPTFR